MKATDKISEVFPLPDTRQVEANNPEAKKKEEFLFFVFIFNEKWGLVSASATN